MTTGASTLEGVQNCMLGWLLSLLLLSPSPKCDVTQLTNSVLITNQQPCQIFTAPCPHRSQVLTAWIKTGALGGVYAKPKASRRSWQGGRGVHICLPLHVLSAECSPLSEHELGAKDQRSVHRLSGCLHET